MNPTLFKTYDLNLAAYLLVYYPLVNYSNNGGRFSFYFTSTPQLKQRVFDFFSKSAETNISKFCDNLRSLKAMTLNLRD